MLGHCVIYLMDNKTGVVMDGVEPWYSGSTTSTYFRVPSGIIHSLSFTAVIP